MTEVINEEQKANLTCIVDRKSIVWYNIFMERLTKNKKIKAKRKYGFMARMATKGGRDVIKRRRNKERTKLSA